MSVIACKIIRTTYIKNIDIFRSYINLFFKFKKLKTQAYMKMWIPGF